MKLGLVARMDNRGLGVQTRGVYDNLHPARTLVIAPGALSPLDQHPEWYPDGLFVRWHGGPLDESAMRRFLTGLDIIYLAETAYDYRLITLAHELGVRVVLHVNAEFYRYHLDTDLPRPDAFWLHSSWLADQIPHDAIVPVPVDRRRFPYRHRTQADTFIHIIGMKASRDRNGTAAILHSLRRIGVPVRLKLFSQARIDRLSLPRNHYLNIEVIHADIPDAYDIYNAGDILLLPRRYGGGCLPMFEALSSGLPVLMTDASPQNTVLPASMKLQAVRSGRIRTQFGPVPAVDAHPSALARAITSFVTTPEDVAAASKEADLIAQAHSWEVQRAVWLTELEKVLAR